MRRITLRIITTWLLASAALVCSYSDSQSEPANDPTYRRLFSDYLGQSEEEADARIAASFEQLFCGDEENERGSSGLYAMMATAALAADRELGEQYVEHLWNGPPPTLSLLRRRAPFARATAGERSLPDPLITSKTLFPSIQRNPRPL